MLAFEEGTMLRNSKITLSTWLLALNTAVLSASITLLAQTTISTGSIQGTVTIGGGCQRG
jgi:hypothetical protein